MRRELKYLVREADRTRLHAAIARFVRSDAHASASGDVPRYTVRSVYLDTPDFRDYEEKEDGRLRRRKLRVRGYDISTGEVYLEVKHKHEGAVWKDRTRVPAPVAARLVAGASPARLLAERALSPSQGRAASAFCYRLRREGRRPTLLVTYDREPLVGRLDPSLRITFDRRLRCAAYPRFGNDFGGLYSEREVREVLPGHFILEVKYDRVHPSWLRPIIGRFGLRQQPLSKYGMGIAQVARARPWRFAGRAAMRALAPSP